MRKIFSLILILMFSFSCLAQEIITGTENKEGETILTEKGIEILNEELRKTRKDVEAISGDATRVLMWFIAGDLEVGTNSSAYLIVPFSGTITTAKAYCKTAPTSADLIIDLNLNGTTLWASGKLTVSAGANTGSKTTFDSTTVAADDYFTIDIDQIGSGTAGADLTVMLYIDETLESRF